MNFSPTYKVVLLGEGRVGKTSLLSRYLHNTFDDQEASTSSATMYSTTSVLLPESLTTSGVAYPSSVSVAVWDTAGQERFHALAPMYYRNADGAVLVYDVTDAETLAKAETWVQELHAVLGEEAIVIVLCGNKVDGPPEEREVSEAEGEAMAARCGAVHLCSSAKTGFNVSEIFATVATKMVQRRAQRSVMGGPRGGGGPRPPRRGGVRVATDDSAEDSPSTGGLYGLKTGGGGQPAPSPRRYGSGAQPFTLNEPDGRGRHEGGAPSVAGSESGGCC